MFKKIRQVQIIDEQLVKWLKQLDEVELHNDEEYTRILRVVEDLYEQKAKMQSGRMKLTDIVNDRVLASVVGLVGVVLVLRYEETEVVTGKAFGMANDILGR